MISQELIEVEVVCFSKINKTQKDKTAYDDQHPNSTMTIWTNEMAIQVIPNICMKFS